MLLNTSAFATPNYERQKLYENKSDNGRAEKFALLIGINSYPTKPLKGCVNDANSLKTILTRKFNFSDDYHIKTLLNEQATKSAIENAFETHLVSNAKRLKSEGKQGIFVLQFSGHGSRVPDVNGDEPDGWDETLCPVDTDLDSSSHDLIDDEIESMLTVLTKYTDNVTLIIDSCHSGTATRDLDFTPRRLERPTLKAKNGAEQSDISPAKLPLSPSPKYVVLSGCMPGELSLETADDTGAHHGLMTSALIAALENASETSTYRDIWEKVDAGIKSKGISSQNPQVEGDLNRELFKGICERKPSTFKVINYLAGTDTVQINAGKTIGIESGGIVAFYRKGAKTFTGDNDNIALGSVTQAFNYISVVKIPETGNVSADEIQNAQVVPVTPFFGQKRLCIAINTTDCKRSATENKIWKEIKAALQNTTAFDVQEIAAKSIDRTRKTWDVSIETATGKSFEERGGSLPSTVDKNVQGFFIATKENSPLFNSFVPIDTRNGARKICIILNNRLRQEALKLFSNERSGISSGLEVTLERVVSGTKEANDYKFKTEPSDNFSIPCFARGDRFRLVLKNTGLINLFVTGVCIGTDGSIAVAFPRAGHGAGRGDELLTGKTVYSPVFTVDQTTPLGFETLKLLVTTDPVDYSPLQQAAVGLETLAKTTTTRGDERCEGVRSMLLQAMYKPEECSRAISSFTPKLSDWFTKRIDYRIIEKTEVRN
ncbi:caspase family protein [Candidatus Obscuribacterales bacterium]|nr:caspase family protein [Candidatus Obscuribacterales bacterium]